MKKFFYWTTAFTSLLVFTLSIFGVIPDLLIKRAYASAIERLHTSTNSKYLILPAVNSNRKIDIFKLIIDRLIEQDRLCEISQDQYDELSNSYNVTSEQMNIQGNNITLAKMSGGKINVGKIYQYLLQENNKPLKCVPLKYNKYIYLLLSANVS